MNNTRHDRQDIGRLLFVLFSGVIAKINNDRPDKSYSEYIQEQCVHTFDKEFVDYVGDVIDWEKLALIVENAKFEWKEVSGEKECKATSNLETLLR